MSGPTALNNFRFKGSRQYIHGSDLFNELTRFFSVTYPGFLEEIAFRAFATHQCEIFLDSTEGRDRNTVCQGKWNTGNGRTIKFRVVETDTPVTDRYEYREALVTQSACIETCEITGRFNPDFSAIENIIAFTKVLHNEHCPLDKGKWFFAQLNTIGPLPLRSQSITIRIKNNIKSRFTLSNILLDETPVGSIRFIST